MHRLPGSTFMRYGRFIAAAVLSAILSVSALALSQKDDAPLKITSKPQANARGCKPGSSGVTSVRVTFDKSGKVTEATTIAASGCGPFDREALRAARNIKFEPARKKGGPVTTVKTVEYAFRIY